MGNEKRVKKGRPRRAVTGVRFNLLIDPTAKARIFQIAYDQRTSAGKVIESLIGAINDHYRSGRISIDRRRLKKVISK